MKFLVLISCVFVLSTLRAQETPKDFDLKACLIYAAENSPFNKQVVTSRRESKAQMKLGKSEFLPQINAYSDYRQYFDNTTYVFPSTDGGVISGGTSDGPYPIRLGQRHNLFAGAKVSQVLFDKRWLTSNEYERLTSELLNLSEEAINDEIILSVSTTFYEIKKLKSKSIKIIEGKERLQRLKEITQLQKENDVVKKSDFDRLELRSFRLDIDSKQLLNTIDLLMSRLKYLMGFPEQNVLTLEEEEINISILPTSEMPSAQSRIIEVQQKLGALKLKSTNDSYFPSIRAYGDFQFQAQRNSFNFLSNEKWFPQHYVGVGVNFPILNGFEKKAKLELGNVELDELKFKQDQVSNEEAFQIQKVKNNIETAGTNLEYTRREKMLSGEVVQHTRLEYEQGVTSLRDLLLAESEQTEAANQYEEAYFEYKLAQINYLKATSGLESLLH